MTTKTTFTRKSALDSTRVEHDEPEQGVDHEQGARIGIALMGNVAGIESEPPTGNVKKALEDEKFFAEMVEIQLHDPANESDQQYVEAGVNGDRICLPRNSELTHRIRRYHLAVIAGAKIQRLVQKKITLADGSMGYEEKAVLQPLYPFSVISDPNPRGVTWLRQALQRS